MDVLIVDDDAITRFALSAAVEEWGFVPVLAENADQALKTLATETTPHPLIIDWSMPGMSGPDLCKTIRKREDGQFFYILMLTGKEGNEAIIEAMEAGADDFLTKPFVLAELVARIRAMLRRRAAAPCFCQRARAAATLRAGHRRHAAAAGARELDQLPQRLRLVGPQRAHPD